jgi:hypothetical protein
LRINRRYATGIIAAHRKPRIETHGYRQTSLRDKGKPGKYPNKAFEVSDTKIIIAISVWQPLCVLATVLGFSRLFRD